MGEDPSIPADSMLPPKVSQKRKNIVGEMLSTEESYVQCLVVLVEKYMKPLLAMAGTEALPRQSPEEVRRIFANVEALIPVNQHLMRAINARVKQWSDVQLIGDVYLKMAPYFKIYNEYSNLYESNGDLLAKLKADPMFSQQIERIQNTLPEVVGFESLLIMPVQRIPRYTLLIRDLLEKTPQNHPDHNNLADAGAEFDNVMQYLDKNISENENMKKFMEMSHMKGGQQLIQAHRVLITEGIACIKKQKSTVTPTASGQTDLASQLRDSAAAKGISKGFKRIAKFAKNLDETLATEDRLHIWLFNDVLVHLKVGKTKKSNVSSTKYQWPLQLVWLKDVEEEDVDDQKMPWSFVLVGPLKTYTLKFITKEEKIHWMNTIRTAVKKNLTAENAPDEQRRYGAYTFPKSGGSYDGWWKFGRIHGDGVFKFFGNKYSGQWEYNCKNGIGTFECVTGEVYHGEWKDDKPWGTGKFEYSNKATYNGEWRDGTRSGKGILTFGRGDKYDGVWADNLPNGEGTYTSTSGLAYKGGWNGGQLHGFGILVAPNGKRYAGEFRNGCKEGEGKMDYARGDFYIGQWKNDKRHGFGIYHSAVEGVYEGFFVADLQEGQGIMRFKHGTVYDGAWKKGLYHGQGVLTCKDGAIEKYDGQWELGRHNGRGVLAYRSGAKYDGTFKDDKPHGTGTYTSANMVMFEGKWVEGRREGKASLSVGPSKFSSTCMNGMMADGERSFLVVPDVPTLHFEL
eukprot:TRINITY_DN1376_c0_g1_i1.p2 TRINITY_DN1376_c0_g1~~TRINITY_DN1376_c0_g1_i1.p2  ORF type:complete len:756 (-),score=308.87 TRINITY_DN1376_c0_g1_i1:484-2697(-)